MAAVGNNVPIIGLIVSLCMGLALGANVVVAQALGMRDVGGVVELLEHAGKGERQRKEDHLVPDGSAEHV